MGRTLMYIHVLYRSGFCHFFSKSELIFLKDQPDLVGFEYSVNVLNALIQKVFVHYILIFVFHQLILQRNGSPCQRSYQKLIEKNLKPLPKWMKSSLKALLERQVNFDNLTKRRKKLHIIEKMFCIFRKREAERLVYKIVGINHYSPQQSVSVLM